jgi:hypothetical protein
MFANSRYLQKHLVVEYEFSSSLHKFCICRRHPSSFVYTLFVYDVIEDVALHQCEPLYG